MDYLKKNNMKQLIDEILNDSEVIRNINDEKVMEKCF